jgi:hypothetical protein
LKPWIHGLAAARVAENATRASVPRSIHESDSASRTGAGWNGALARLAALGAAPANTYAARPIHAADAARRIHPSYAARWIHPSDAARRPHPRVEGALRTERRALWSELSGSAAPGERREEQGREHEQAELHTDGGRHGDTSMTAKEKMRFQRIER